MKQGLLEFGGAMVLLVLALGWTAHSALRLPAQSRLWKQRQGDIRELASLRSTLTEWENMVAAFSDRIDDSTEDIRALIQNQFPGLSTTIHLEHSGPAWPGWQVEQYQVRIDSIPSDAIGALLTMLDAQRPPWRLTHVQIEASEHEYDQARLRLGLEGIKPER